MIRLIQKVSQADHVDNGVTLTLDQRIRSRLRVILDDGAEAGILLERGTTLKEGDLLQSEDGHVVRVSAAEETVSVVECDDPLLLARACYHLGNRHVPLQISEQRIAYLHDHVLDDMVTGLGLEVNVTEAPFEPEPGAYGGSSAQGGHHHHHEHAHGHHA
jgi:urease accessory protein